MLLIGGNNLSAFAGSEGIGLSLSGVGLGIALMTEQVEAGPNAPEARSWTSAQATIDAASFAGVEGLTIEVDTLALEVNRKATDGSVVDYSLTASTAVAATAPNTDLVSSTCPVARLQLGMAAAGCERTRSTVLSTTSSLVSLTAVW